MWVVEPISSLSSAVERYYISPILCVLWVTLPHTIDFLTVRIHRWCTSLASAKRRDLIPCSSLSPHWLYRTCSAWFTVHGCQLENIATRLKFFLSLFVQRVSRSLILQYHCPWYLTSEFDGLHHIYLFDACIRYVNPIALDRYVHATIADSRSTIPFTRSGWKYYVRLLSRWLWVTEYLLLASLRLLARVWSRIHIFLPRGDEERESLCPRVYPNLNGLSAHIGRNLCVSTT